MSVTCSSSFWPSSTIRCARSRATSRGVVARRTREIGIRVALGAHPRRLLVSIFARVARQLALGVAAGSLASAIVVSAAGLDVEGAGLLLIAVATLMLAVGAIAALGPARRSLRIQAAEALRGDA